MTPQSGRSPQQKDSLLNLHPGAISRIRPRRRGRRLRNHHLRHPSDHNHTPPPQPPGGPIRRCRQPLRRLPDLLDPAAGGVLPAGRPAQPGRTGGSSTSLPAYRQRRQPHPTRPPAIGNLISDTRKSATHGVIMPTAGENPRPCCNQTRLQLPDSCYHTATAQEEDIR